MKRKFDLIGVGESGVDLIYALDHMPGRGEKARAKEIGKYPGGMIGNFCAAAAKQGLRCGVVTAVGDDENGRLLKEDYQKLGIDTTHVLVEQGSTFCCLIFLDKTGEKQLITVDTPLQSPPLNRIDFSYLKLAKFVHLNSMDYTLADAVTKGLWKSETKVSLDYEAHAQNAGLARWSSILERVSVLFLNEESAAQLVNGAPEAQIRRLLELGPKTVVITCADSGGFVAEEGGIVRYRAVSVDKIADTTGAGDCFNASFLAERLRGESLERAAQHAAMSAALSIRRVGARTGQPTRAQTLLALRTGF